MVVDKCFVDEGFGFGKVPTGEIVFIHASVVHGGEVLMIGTDAWVQVVNDEARAEGGYRARNAWGRNAWKQERDREKANRVAQQVRRAAALTAELAAQSVRKVAKEEAWRLFERQPGFKRKTREEFEEEFGRNVRNVMGNSRGEQEKAVHKCTGQEDSNYQRRRAWEKIWDPRVLALSPFLAAGN